MVGSLVGESVAMATTGAVVPGFMEYEVQYLLQYNNTHTRNEQWMCKNYRQNYNVIVLYSGTHVHTYSTCTNR